MWCPSGHARFLEIHQAIRGIVKTQFGHTRILEKMETCRDRNFPQLKRQGSSPLTYEDSRAEILADCINEFFSNCPSLSVFSPSGDFLRIDSRIGAYRKLPNVGWQYMFIEAASGVISRAQFQRCSAAADQALQSMRKNIEEIDRDESSYYDYIKLCAVEDDQEIWSHLEIFEGWAVGCAWNDIPKRPDDFVALDLQFDTLIENDEFESLKDAIIQAFDRGLIRSKQSLWKERFPNETREAFRAAWAEAALERPNLSKRGPK